MGGGDCAWRGASETGGRPSRRPYTLNTLHRTPYTLHLTPYTLHPTPYTLRATPYTPYALHPTSVEAGDPESFCAARR